MSSAWIVMLILAVIGVIKMAAGGMIREEAQTRLGRIPHALIRLALLRVPRELRGDLAAEWYAELEHVLTGTEGLPLTRLIRGVRFAAGLLVSARAVTDELTRSDGTRTMRWVVPLVMGVDALQLLYTFSAITYVNWARPLSITLAFAVMLAAMVTLLSVGFLRFTGDHLHRYKTDIGIIPLRSLDRLTAVVTGTALFLIVVMAALMFVQIHAEVLYALGPNGGITAVTVSLAVALVCIMANLLVLGVYALRPSDIRSEPPGS